VCIGWFLSAWGQLTYPKASPFAKIEQEIGLSNISVAYSRPAVKGRLIFGNDSDGLPGLVPYGRIWRVGANEATKITFDTDVHVLGNTLQKGSYALYAFPSEKDWQIVFHKNTTHWGDGRTAYDASQDALRVSVTPTKTIYYQENFSISFDSITHDSVNMIWQWANTKITVPIAVDTNSVMEKQIEHNLEKSPTAQTYYEIARYYQEQGVKTSEALEHVNKALELGGETYYFYRIKSLLQAELGQYTAAILSAIKSRDISESLGKDEFVRMNQRNIKLWEKIKNAVKEER
jgi:tetratricopeptide (TPR) repeat protein